MSKLHSAMMTFLAIAAIRSASANLAIEDPKGDQELRVEGILDAPIPPDTPIDTDLASITVTEHETTITIEANIHETTSPTTALSGLQFKIGFQLNNQPYLVDTHHVDNKNGPGIFRIDEQGGARKIGEATRIPGDHALKVDLPREILWDENGAVIGPGDKLHEFTTYLGGSLTSIAGVTIQPFDVLDDNQASLDILTGVNQTGTIQLTSEQTSRYSNGEQASFIFPFQVINTADEEQTISLQWTGPSNWRIETPQPEATILPKQSLHSFLVATIPFNHQHGVQEIIKLEATNGKPDEEPGRIEFGIRFLEVPQPAGHHNEVYIHSHADPNPDITREILSGGARAYMNTLAEDPQSSLDAIRANSNGRPINEITWSIPLEPGLVLGIDSNNGEGLIELAIQSQILHPGATLQASIQIETNDEIIDLASATSSPSDMQPGTTTEYSLPLNTQEIRLSPADAKQMTLQLELEVLQPTFITAQEIPALLPGAKFTLPLNEYKDDVSEVKGLSPEGFDLSPREFSGPTNAGNTVIATPTLVFEKGGKYEITLQGRAAQHAALAHDPVIQASAGKEIEIPVIITIPADAQVGETLDLILTVTGQGDQGYSRYTYTIVEENIPNQIDDANQILAEFNEETPLPLAIAILGIGIAAHRRSQK